MALWVVLDFYVMALCESVFGVQVYILSYGFCCFLYFTNSSNFPGSEIMNFFLI